MLQCSLQTRKQHKLPFWTWEYVTSPLMPCHGSCAAGTRGPTFYSIFKVSIRLCLNQHVWHENLTCRPRRLVPRIQPSLCVNFKGPCFKENLTWSSGLNTCQVAKTHRIYTQQFSFIDKPHSYNNPTMKWKLKCKKQGKKKKIGDLLQEHSTDPR